MRPSLRGFSLIELSVVLTILSVVIAGILPGITGANKSRDIEVTQARMKAIHEALLAYRIANDELPCPANITIAESASNFGVMAATPGTCTGGTPAANFSAVNAVAGGVPVRSLGLGDEYATDAWGRRFVYHVDVRFTAAGAATTYPPADTTIGTFTVNDQAASARTTKAVYALVSHGPDGHGGYPNNSSTRYSRSITNTDALENCECTNTAASGTYDTTLVQRARYINPSNSLDAFDDLLDFKTRSQVEASSVLSSLWSANGTTNLYPTTLTQGVAIGQSTTTIGAITPKFLAYEGAGDYIALNNTVADTSNLYMLSNVNNYAAYIQNTNTGALAGGMRILNSGDYPALQAYGSATRAANLMWGSYGLYLTNDGASATGILSNIGAAASGTPIGLRTIVASNAAAGAANVYGLHSNVSGDTTGNVFGLHSVISGASTGSAYAGNFQVNNAYLGGAGANSYGLRVVQNATMATGPGASAYGLYVSMGTGFAGSGTSFGARIVQPNASGRGIQVETDGAAADGAYITSTGATGRALYASASGSDSIVLQANSTGPGTTYGVWASAQSDSGFGVYARNTAAGYGVYAISTSGVALRAYSDGTRYCDIGTPTYAIRCTGSAYLTTGTVWTTSDRRLKKDIAPLDSHQGLAGILRLRPVTYQWRDDRANRDGLQNLGFIAQEVEEVFPDLVTASSASDPQTGKEQPYKALDYSRFVAPLVKAVQELAHTLQALADQVKELFARTDAQDERLKTLEAENAALKARLDALEKNASAPVRP